MYINGKAFLIVSLPLFLSAVSGHVILNRGWVKYHNRGPKIFVKNVEHFEPKVVKNSNYLRVNGIIRTLVSGSVRNLSEVKTLRLSLCGIREVNPGAFVNLRSLKTLVLRENEITHIASGVFNNLTVSALYLHKNQIRTIDSDAFDDMPHLHLIKINANNISTWDSNWFKNTPQLTELFFRRNFIEKIPARAFKQLKGGHTSSGTYIVDTRIYLSKNLITSIDPTAFADLTEVQQIWLDRNDLSEIPEHVFAHMKQVDVIFLSKNRLREVPSNIFKSFERELLILDLTRNHNFTCPSYDIVSRVNVTTLNANRRLNCSCVKILTEKLLEDGRNNKIESDCDLSIVR